MAITLLQECSWPGVIGVESLSGTVSHGITPSTWVLTCFPQDSVPDAFGTLVIGDGFRRVALPDCKVETLTGRAGADGQTYTLVISDRRWRWRFGAISGRYNELDNRGKLVPWSIRSPRELAELCLAAMGESNYRIDLPEGLTRAAGANIDRYLLAGENFPQSLTNPPVVWDATPPAEALARLCDLYGCRVVFQPIANRVLITPLGKGRVNLPDGPCESIAPAIARPAIPQAVGVAGAPVRIQARFLLEAVGKEWDGKYLPINDLSYAPQGGNGQVQITKIFYSGPALGQATTNIGLKVSITYYPKWHPPAEPSVTLQFQFGGTDAIETKFAKVAAAINAHPDLKNLIQAQASAATVTLTGKPVGFPFMTTAELSGPVTPGDYIRLAVTQQAELAGGGWEGSHPPNFPEVQATDRLSVEQAQGLARETVFRCYRIRNVDLVTGKYPLTLPWFGPVKRRQQIILQQTKVQQVVPAERIQGGVEKNTTIPGPVRDQFGRLPEYYNGYSQDREATVTGSISRYIGNVLWNPNVSMNTDPEDRVYVGFSVNALEQLVVFNEQVYRDWPVTGPTFNRLLPPALTLETACLIRDADTGEILRWKESMNLGGEAPPEWTIRDDVEVAVVATYGTQNKPQAWGFYDSAQAAARAKYYLAGAAKKFQITGGETRQYIGIHLIDLDGAVQQVSWSIGGAGASTIASTNSEHSAVVPEYPARRRYENLPPNKSNAIANLEEDRLRPKLPGV